MKKRDITLTTEAHRPAFNDFADALRAAETMQEQNPDRFKIIEYSRRIGRSHAALVEEEMRRMLGLWASELEPVAAYDRYGNLLGLTTRAPIGTRMPIAVKTVLPLMFGPRSNPRRERCLLKR